MLRDSANFPTRQRQTAVLVRLLIPNPGITYHGRPMRSLRMKRILGSVSDDMSDMVLTYLRDEAAATHIQHWLEYRIGEDYNQWKERALHYQPHTGQAFFADESTARGLYALHIALLEIRITRT